MKSTSLGDAVAGRARGAMIALAALAAVGLAAACVVEGQGGGGAPERGDVPLCTDADGDGFGLGCPAGQDCDDSDPAVTAECYTCKHDEPGCPCDMEGLRVTCGKVESHVGDQIVCGMGESVCTGGAWSECIINNSVTLAPSGSSAPLTLGPVTACANNPCDPYCKTWNDTTTGLGNDAGLVESDGGLTLPLGEGGAPGPTCSGGASGGCLHSICSAGNKLAPGCDPVAPPPQGTQTVFSEDFANNGKGWLLGTEWQIGAAKASAGQQYGSPDPAADHSSTGDNGVAGVVIGGNATTALHGAYYLTSPIINLSAAAAPVELSFWRWLNSDYAPYMVNTVDVYNGAAWVNLWTSGSFPGLTEAAWSQQQFDVSAYANAGFRVRFGVAVGSSGAYVVGSWSVDDVVITAKGPAPPAPPSCVSQVCALFPQCCNGSWDSGCVAQVASVCKLECANAKGQCVTCYQDSIDHDGDGYSFADGDCKDCDPSINPGAYDFPNGIDEDCNGIVDDGTSLCDVGLAMASSNPFDHAKAIGLCPQANPLATGASKKWGVLSAKLVQADGSSAPNSMTYGILSKYGANNLPKQGANMAIYSSGTARAPGDPGWINPNGQFASYNAGTACAYPSGFPKNKVGCPGAGGTANDSSGLWLQIRTPTNAQSFSYDFDFFSSEYPEWVCTAYNDGYVALLQTGYVPPNPASNSGNISFDSQSNPVSVNIGFFTVPGCPTCTSPKLTGTGFDGLCGGQICGGATDWLETTAPIVPGETITVQFSIWDTGDHVWDSSILIDNWLWSEKPASIQTGKPVAPPPPTYSDAWFVRDFDLSSCPAGTAPKWGLWSWSTATPSDSSIAFYVRTAATAAGLDSAPEDAVLFSNPPGPAALAGAPVVAKAAAPDTQGGSAVVDATLQSAGRPRQWPFVRVRSHLVPSTDKLSAPTLSSWNLQADCAPSQ